LAGAEKADAFIRPAREHKLATIEESKYITIRRGNNFEYGLPHLLIRIKKVQEDICPSASVSKRKIEIVSGVVSVNLLRPSENEKLSGLLKDEMKLAASGLESVKNPLTFILVVYVPAGES
jgi:hypothetical protein